MSPYGQESAELQSLYALVEYFGNKQTPELEMVFCKDNLQKRQEIKTAHAWDRVRHSLVPCCLSLTSYFQVAQGHVNCKRCALPARPSQACSICCSIASSRAGPEAIRTGSALTIDRSWFWAIYRTGQHWQGRLAGLFGLRKGQALRAGVTEMDRFQARFSNPTNWGLCVAGCWLLLEWVASLCCRRSCFSDPKLVAVAG